MSDTTDHGRIRRALAEAKRAHEAATEALRRAEEAAVAAGAEVVAHPDVITVQRINVVEPDGTLRLVITNASQLPGLILRGEEHAHPNREPASGLIFFNDEATEMGGLTFGGLRSSGGYSSGVHLSYDNFEQDQVVVLSSSDDGRAARVAQLEFIDRPEWSIVDLVRGLEKSVGDGADRDVEIMSGQEPARRMRLAREADGSVGLTLADADGRPRIVLHVAADGVAAIKVLDETGGPIAELPDR